MSQSKMNSHIEFRISVHAAASCSFLLHLLLVLTAATSADRSKTSFMHEIRREPATHGQHLSASLREGGTPTQHMQPFRKQTPTGIWFPETALYVTKYSVQSGSYTHKAENELTSISKIVPDSLSPRRVLRDVSPPGMWPPGTDAPPSESFIGFARRRALLAAPDNSKRMKSREGLVLKSTSPGRSLLRDTSPPGMWPGTDASPPSEEFGRSRSLSKVSAPVHDTGEDTFSLKQADVNAVIRRPGLWPVTGSPPSEFASRGPLTAALQARRDSHSFSSDNVHRRLTSFPFQDNFHR